MLGKTHSSMCLHAWSPAWYGMKKKVLIPILIIVAALTVFLIFKKSYTEKLLSEFLEIKDAAETVTEELKEEIKKEISNPPPLRLVSDAPSSSLTNSGVIQWTNVQRTNNGLTPLAGNAKLDQAALLKVQDMFSRQYFEHVSPTGGSISNLAEAVGYEYLIIGENLALGNYEDDQALVQAWMDSPGHRANILKSGYTEIGVAVMRGTFEGRKTWLAVQVFAKPLAACSKPDAFLEAEIGLLETELDELKRQADQLLYELENANPKRGEEYNRKVDQYNYLVDQINALVAQLKSKINQYNQQVQIFNACAAQ